MTEPIILALLGLLVLEMVIHAIERRDLYNRIMAKDLTEYKKQEVKPGKSTNVIAKNFEKNFSHID